MANDKDKKNDPAFDDFDDEFFSSLDTEGSNLENLDVDTTETNSKSDRKPLDYVKSAAAELSHIGKHASMGAATAIADKIKRELPEVTDMGRRTLQQVSELNRLKNDVIQDIRPTLNQTKILTRQMMKYSKDLMPESLYNKLDQMLATPEEERDKGPSKEEARESLVGDQLSSIFATQAKIHSVERKQAAIESAIDKRISASRFAETSSILNDIRTQAVFQTAFTKSTYTAYLKKSLELQYKQLFVAEDLLETVRIQAQTNEKHLDAIRHNTALPDSSKIHKSEVIKRNLREKFLGGISDWMSNFTTNMVKNITKEYVEPFKDAIGGINDAMSSMLMMLEMQESMGEKFNARKTLTGWGGGLLGKALGAIGGRKLLNFIPEQKRRALNAAAANADLSLPLLLEQFASRNDLNQGAAGIVARFLQNVLPKRDKTGGTFEGLNVSSSLSESGGAITNKFTTSVETIIPGYLSMIHQQLAKMNGDTEAQRLFYSFKQKKFITSAGVQDEMKAAYGIQFKKNKETGKYEANSEENDALAKASLDVVRDSVNYDLQSKGFAKGLSSDKRSVNKILAQIQKERNLALSLDERANGEYKTDAQGNRILGPSGQPIKMTAGEKTALRQSAALARERAADAERNLEMIKLLNPSGRDKQAQELNRQFNQQVVNFMFEVANSRESVLINWDDLEIFKNEVEPTKYPTDWCKQIFGNIFGETVDGVRDAQKFVKTFWTLTHTTRHGQEMLIPNIANPIEARIKGLMKNIDDGRQVLANAAEAYGGEIETFGGFASLNEYGDIEFSSKKASALRRQRSEQFWDKKYENRDEYGHLKVAKTGGEEFLDFMSKKIKEAPELADAAITKFAKMTGTEEAWKGTKDFVRDKYQEMRNWTNDKKKALVRRAEVITQEALFGFLSFLGELGSDTAAGIVAMLFTPEGKWRYSTIAEKEAKSKKNYKQLKVRVYDNYNRMTKYDTADIFIGTFDPDEIKAIVANSVGFKYFHRAAHVFFFDDVDAMNENGTNMKNSSWKVTLFEMLPEGAQALIAMSPEAIEDLQARADEIIQQYRDQRKAYRESKAPKRKAMNAKQRAEFDRQEQEAREAKIKEEAQNAIRAQQEEYTRQKEREAAILRGEVVNEESEEESSNARKARHFAERRKREQQEQNRRGRRGRRYAEGGVIDPFTGDPVGVVKYPTLLARGRAVAGEHGAEAIIPLNKTEAARNAYKVAKAYHEGNFTEFAEGGVTDGENMLKKLGKRASQFFKKRGNTNSASGMINEGLGSLFDWLSESKATDKAEQARSKVNGFYNWLRSLSTAEGRAQADKDIGQLAKDALEFFGLLKSGEFLDELEKEHPEDATTLHRVIACIKKGDIELNKLTIAKGTTPALKQFLRRYKNNAPKVVGKFKSGADFFKSFGTAEGRSKARDQVFGAARDAADKVGSFKFFDDGSTLGESASRAKDKIFGLGKDALNKLTGGARAAISVVSPWFKNAHGSLVDIAAKQLEVQSQIAVMLGHQFGIEPSKLEKLKDVGGKTVKEIKGILGNIWSATKILGKGAKAAVWDMPLWAGRQVKDFAGSTISNRITAVYVNPLSGETLNKRQHLRISYEDFKKGVFDSDDPQTRQRIMSVDDIDGQVYNGAGKPLFNFDTTPTDVERGFCDEKGRPIRSLSRALGRFVHNTAAGTMRGIGKGISAGWNKLRSFDYTKVRHNLWETLRSPLTALGAIKNIFTDVYRKDEIASGAIAYGEYFKQGYYVFLDGSEIKDCYHIDKPVVWAARDKQGNNLPKSLKAVPGDIVISAMDIEHGLVDKNNRSLGNFAKKVGGLLGRLGRFGGAVFKYVTMGPLGPIALAKDAITWALTKNDPYIDVYVCDDQGKFTLGRPRLTGEGIRNGQYYTTDKSGKMSELKSAYGITKPVLNAKGVTLITQAEIDEKRLVDKDGKKLTAWRGRSNIGKIASGAFGAALWAGRKLKTGLQMVGRAASFFWNKGKNIATKGLGKLFGAADDAIKSIFDFAGDLVDRIVPKDLILRRTDLEEVVGDRLVSIYNLLDARLARAPAFGDLDGDGDVENSYRDKQQRRQKRKEQAAQAAAAAGGATGSSGTGTGENDEGLSAGQAALLGAGGAGGLSALWAGAKSLFGKGKNVVKKGASKLAKFLPKSKLGKLGLLGLSAAGLSSLFGNSANASEQNAQSSGLDISNMSDTAGHDSLGQNVERASVGAEAALMAGMAGRKTKAFQFAAKKLGSIFAKRMATTAVAAGASASTGVGAVLAPVIAVGGALWTAYDIASFIFGEGYFEREWREKRLVFYGFKESNDDAFDYMKKLEDLMADIIFQSSWFSKDSVSDWNPAKGFLSADAPKEVSKIKLLLLKEGGFADYIKSLTVDGKPASKEEKAKEEERILKFLDVWFRTRFVPVWLLYVSLTQIHTAKEGEEPNFTSLHPEDIPSDSYDAVLNEFNKEAKKIISKNSSIIGIAPNVASYQKMRDTSDLKNADVNKGLNESLSGEELIKTSLDANKDKTDTTSAAKLSDTSKNGQATATSKAAAAAALTQMYNQNQTTGGGAGSAYVAPDIKGLDKVARFNSKVDTTNMGPRIWEALKKLGLSEAGIAGVLGNLQVESAGLNPEISEMGKGFKAGEYTAFLDGLAADKTLSRGAIEKILKEPKHARTGYGLAQWTYYTRKAGLVMMAREMGKSVADPEVQMAYLLQELSQGKQNKQLLSLLQTTDDVQAAADAFMNVYERPAKGKEHADQRRGAAQAFYDKLSERGKKLAATNSAPTDTSTTSSDISSSDVDTGGSSASQSSSSSSSIDTASSTTSPSVSTSDTGGGSGGEIGGDGAVPANDVPQQGNSTVVNKILQTARKNAQGASYSQANRQGNKSYDCSSFVSRTLKEVGLNVSPDNNTDTLPKALTAVGFKPIPGPVGNAQQLQPGDIMLRTRSEGHGHTEIYTGDGKSVGAHSEKSGVSERKHWPGYQYTRAYRFGGNASDLKDTTLSQAANDAAASYDTGTTGGSADTSSAMASTAAPSSSADVTTTGSSPVSSAASESTTLTAQTTSSQSAEATANAPGAEGSPGSADALLSEFKNATNLLAEISKSVSPSDTTENGGNSAEDFTTASESLKESIPTAMKTAADDFASIFIQKFSEWWSTQQNAGGGVSASSVAPSLASKTGPSTPPVIRNSKQPA